MNRFFLIITFLIFAITSFAQGDSFTGEWEMKYTPVQGTPVTIKLHVGIPEKNQLYPAQLILQSPGFTASYHLLLFKRNVRQLAIGKQKVPIEETPFSIGNWTVQLNGVFDLSRDIKGLPVLTAERMIIKDLGLEMVPDVGKFQKADKEIAEPVVNLLQQTEIKLKKLSSDAFQSPYTDTILQPLADYFGVMDTIHVDERYGNFRFNGSKKSENGIVSVLLNGAAMIDQNDLAEKKPSEDFRLDTGLNILVFYADNYGKSTSTTGKANVQIGKTKFQMNFADKINLASTFIVAKIYYYPPKENEITSLYTSDYINQASDADIQRDIKMFHYPDPSGRNLLKNDTARAQAEMTLLRDSKSVGNIQSNTRQIILALWDDAVEDGDSISLNINGNWIVQGFAVKKKPRFIAVTLEPGANKIIFIANNLGSISPNTSVLEIIDGRQRKSFMIDTNLSQNNLININYTLKPN